MNVDRTPRRSENLLLPDVKGRRFGVAPASSGQSARTAGVGITLRADPGVAGAAADDRLFSNFADGETLERKGPNGRFGIVVVAVEVLRDGREEAVFTEGASPVARRVRGNRQALCHRLVPEPLLEEFERLLTDFPGENAAGKMTVKSGFQRLIAHCVVVSESERKRTPERGRRCVLEERFLLRDNHNESKRRSLPQGGEKSRER